MLKLEVNSYGPLFLFLPEFSFSAHLKHCQANKAPEKKYWGLGALRSVFRQILDPVLKFRL